MSDIIHLLPDSVANQIAAGEVIQRPASVVKELVENAIDAGATSIHVIIKDAGRTLIQIIDNGKGMSMTDARMAFERHATSKIRKASDLFALRTMGFRGEALASIAAIAQVELRTRREEDEVGCRLLINGSEVEAHEPCMTAVGSNFQIKNIFFNVPARRKFLKSNTTELNNIVTEFERIALVNPSVSFTLSHNDNEIINLHASMLKQRIVSLFKDKKLNQQLLPVEVKTSLINISGYICRPEDAKKKNFLQYFFVNDRYMRHPYFHKAVMQCYEKLIPQIGMPKYFLYFSVDPANIDVNIHPTKTEIKFENESHIWQIISAAIKEALGKFSAVPSIDFDMDDAPEIPVHNIDRVHTPQSGNFYNPFQQETAYNPFESKEESDSGEFIPEVKSTVSTISSSINKKSSPSSGGALLGSKVNKPKVDPQWSTLYSGFGNATDLPMNEIPVKSGGYNPFDESNLSADETEPQADFDSHEFSNPEEAVEFEGDPDYFHTDEVFPASKAEKQETATDAGSKDMPESINQEHTPSVQTISSKVNIPSVQKDVSEGLFGSKINAEEKRNISQPQIIPSSDTQKPLTGSYKQYLQVKGKYIVTNVKSGVMMIDQFRASKRIFFEKYMAQIASKKGVSQGVLFPDIITLSVADQTIFDAITDDLSFLGFEISNLGNGSYAINGIPAEIKNTDNIELINSMIETAKTKGRDVKADYQELLALRLAESAALPYGQNLSPDDMEHLIDNLFATSSPNYSPDGKVIISVMSLDEIGKRFK